MRFVRKNGVYELTQDAYCGRVVDCFFAFTCWEGSFWSAHRRHMLFAPEQFDLFIENPNRYTSDIVVVKWKKDGDDLIPEHEEVIGRGNDPRVVMVGEQPLVLYRGSIHSSGEYFLYSLKFKYLLPLFAEDEWFRFGKNWVPFEQEGLKAIHGFDPFCILEIDIETGEVKTTQTIEQPFAHQANHDGYSVLRGGSNALETDGILWGLGHSTFKSYHHYPFIWHMGDGGKLSISYDQQFMDINKAGFGIIDPTSICLDDDANHWVGLCCSERDWFYDQAFVNVLAPMSVVRSNSVSKIEGHAFKLEVVTENFKIRPTQRTFIACDFKETVDTALVPYGAKMAYPGDEGFVLCGRYEKFEKGKYAVRFRYLADGPIEEKYGRVDVTRCRNKRAHTIVESEIIGTANELHLIELECELDCEAEERIEARMYTDGRVKVTALDVRFHRRRS